jgi:glutaredoxin 3
VKCLITAVLGARGSGALAAMSSVDARQRIKDEVKSSQVVVFSKSYCSFCAKTKGLFDGLNAPYTAIELDLIDEGPELQEELLAMTGQRTVPNVFVGGTHVGGNDDAHAAAQSGELQKMLSK